MCGRSTPERSGEIRRRGECRAVRIHTSGQSRGDFLQQPAVAVGIPKRGVGAVAATVRIRAADPVSPRQIGLVGAGVFVADGEEDFADEGAAATSIVTVGFDFGGALIKQFVWNG